MALAMAFRRRFGHDVVVDLVGYRRFGHNEQDEPAYTQPLMAEAIEGHPTVREQYAARLQAEGVVTEAEASALVDATQAELRAAHDRLKRTLEGPRAEEAEPVSGLVTRRSIPPYPRTYSATSIRSCSGSQTASRSIPSSRVSSSAGPRRSHEG